MRRKHILASQINYVFEKKVVSEKMGLLWSH